MQNAESLIECVRAYNPRTNTDLIRRAYAFGEAMHEGQYRKSGEPYFTHPVAVAFILAEQRMDDATIITALLHDTVEDTRSTKDQVAELFSPEIADLVDGVTKLTKIELSSVETKQAENIRKLLMAIAKDVRVIFVKLADRLHNMRTIGAMKVEKQIQKANETMDIFAPLAGRMGMQYIREELEDLSFSVLNPEGRKSIIRRFAMLKRDSGDVVERIIGDIRHEMAAADIEADVYGRTKRAYSMWRKMQEKELSFSRLSDIFGFRVIVDTEMDCYRALGVIHQRWRSIPGRFKDYISQPKSNGYRSIHTTVSGRDGKRVEVQIRTHKMHEVAESGVAAHWAYRDGERTENKFAVDPSRWVSELIEQFNSVDDPQDFLDAVKLEMYTDKVFCFSPKGDVIKLPRNATPIDFAYAIHTDIGDKCQGAKIDGIRQPLWTRLRNGQSVEIITADGQVPEAKWLSMTATGKARDAIKHALKTANKDRYALLGQELARVAFEHIGKKATDQALAIAAQKLSLKDARQVVEMLGSSQIEASDVVKALYPDLRPTQQAHVRKENAVVGLRYGQSFTRAMCCAPLPGERIVGIQEPERGVFVHTVDCMSLAKYEEDEETKWIDIQWHSGTHPAEYAVPLELTINNDAGVLGKVCALVAEQRANISDLEFLDRKTDFYKLRLEVDLRDIKQLHTLLSALKAETDVALVSRLRDLSLAETSEAEF